MKYNKIIEKLVEDELYTPATIAALGEALGMVDTSDPEKRKRDRQRIRIALGRFSNNHNFPDEGDGIVTLKGQAPTPGWFGWRWKAALHE
ncbi:hypothetical protein SCOR_24745 [Sulfidibacter corallicola]|uniref:Uncharacterized protein n=1 Tax=Sulfidibacter corallicola TaxID=2818388 RepID=A0A8A4TS93_SULCO|nr:hypothetical protein [Sulfidibacter corallicola]QTD52383.1 hypothetical protein J3U87_07910 [Sulfidibacter corallicola]